MKLQLLCSEKGQKSESLKRVALELSERLGYVVQRVVEPTSPNVLRWGAKADKLEQYKKFQQLGINGLEFTTDQAIAGSWFMSGNLVVGRKLLSSYEGKGIVMFEPHKAPTKEDVLACKVFTKFIPKEREFRVHVFKGTPLVTLEKKLKNDWKGPTSEYIKNTEHGYVFCQHDVSIPSALQKQINDLAVASSKVCASDFQGIDIGYHEAKKNLFVIEVNSAPGIEGSNVKRYCDAIESYLASKNQPKVAVTAPTAAWPL